MPLPISDVRLPTSETHDFTFEAIGTEEVSCLPAARIESLLASYFRAMTDSGQSEPAQKDRVANGQVLPQSRAHGYVPPITRDFYARLARIKVQPDIGARLRELVIEIA